MAEPKPRTIRCAIYTRKSTEEGLDQEFNSLDAQREACSAYVLSQRHEGWTLLPEQYDDGGFSGGNMDRPGMQRLMAAVAAGNVDVIVVYKVDRLTRSLADFAKIVEVLDEVGASFVSITQSFNTTTSMGRLTLNVLLSFAQFEREVTGERIRDKIAASKRKGMWMGGPVPLGYEVKDRKLVPNETEAEVVRTIMRRYLAVASVRELIAVLAAEGVRTKLQVNASGPHRGGIPFARGSLIHLLKNRIYIGNIVHKGVAHPGEHAPILPQELWDAVQTKLADSGPARIRATNIKHRSLLAGLLYDGLGRRMSTSHANKGTKRYRYYLTHPDEILDRKRPAHRVPAHDLESVVIDKLSSYLADRGAIYDAVITATTDARQIDDALEAAGDAAIRLRSGVASVQLEVIELHLTRVTSSDDEIELTVDLQPLIPDGSAQPISIKIPVARVRRGHDVRLIIPTGEPELEEPQSSSELIDLLAEAMQARRILLTSPGKSIEQIASELGRCRTRFVKLVRISWLAPAIVKDIVAAKWSDNLSEQRLLNVDLPVSWTDQRAMLAA
jgi:site-specific DNA recombinase